MDEWFFFYHKQVVTHQELLKLVFYVQGVTSSGKGDKHLRLYNILHLIFLTQLADANSRNLTCPGITRTYLYALLSFPRGLVLLTCWRKCHSTKCILLLINNIYNTHIFNYIQFFLPMEITDKC